MEFKKIDNTKFQCLLDQDDLEDNNISLDDFFRNDTEKIHGLLDVVMEEAEKNIGVVLQGGVMSLQLAPQPNHSILLTVSSGQDDFSNMVRQASERVTQDLTDVALEDEQQNNVIKKDSKTQASAKDIDFSSVHEKTEQNAQDEETKPMQKKKERAAVFCLQDMNTVEQFCTASERTWGIANALYRNNATNQMYLLIVKGRCSEEKYKAFINLLREFGEFQSTKVERIAYIKEHHDAIIKNNAVNILKKYCI
jgi:adapter protein MecA 1/2